MTEDFQPIYFKRAVEIAQKGGYDVKWSNELVCYVGEDFRRCLTQKEIWSDRFFWVSLGNALNWGHCLNCGDSGQVPIGENRVSLDMAIDAGDRSLEGTLHSIEMGQCEVCGGTQPGDWIYYWHQFIDHLVAEKDPDDFFASLLPKGGDDTTIEYNGQEPRKI